MEKKPYVIGLDLGGTNSVFGIVDKKANVVASVSVKTRGHGTADQYVADCCEALKPVIEQVGGIDKIHAMGIGAPNGNYYNGSIENAPNLEWPGIVPLAQMFSDKHFSTLFHPSLNFPKDLEQWLSKCGPQASSISIS